MLGRWEGAGVSAYRATIEFPDDCANAVTEWTTAEAARRWGAAMERLTPGAVAMDLEAFCPMCLAWEDLTMCAACGDVPVCAKVAGDTCEDCATDVEAECACPGFAEVGPCHCPACGAA